ncbi:serine/threonine protein kinase [Streptomyces sp. NBC_01221]|uniref:serine/threonine-protein kinase n=1 Tax=Streptomyces sp. NBC_01221 TaxID=2903782 RepID=UPI0022594E2F|nr:serine/threonine-protein kinase [Streptomyces sp. NBC_01221]MCX4791884.1 serine/threonine protein kinase [Streptomyces sp. NBC_01221]
MRGTTVANRYRLVDAIGSGGMGAVWRAEDLQEGPDVALKIISLGEGDAVREAAFRREARVATRLSHPHVVAVHDHGAAHLDGQHTLFLVMDLVDGPPLSALTTRPLPLADTLTWATQISQALEAAHRAGIVHRDIKPSNILIDPHDSAQLCDFGIARLADTTQHTLTITGAAIGTPSYMSPEQARGDKDLAAPSDLYSLGCLIHELLTGTVPFAGSGWQVLNQHLHSAPAPLSALRPGVPGELEQLVLELLDKNPGRRPTATETRRRLSQLHAALSELAAAPTVTSDRHPAAPTLVDTPDSTVARRRGPSPRVTALWTGAVAGAAIASELTLASIPSPWATVLGTLAGLLLTVFYLLDPPRPPHPGQLQITTAGLFTLLLLTGGASLALLVSTPSLWWTALTAAALGCPTLIGCASCVRRTVEHMLRRTAWSADLATTAGALHTTALLLAADHAGLSVLALTAAGPALWPATALLTAVVTPSGSRVRPGNATPRHCTRSHTVTSPA